MSVWMVILVMGKVGGSIGPLPYDMAECQTRALEKNAEMAAIRATGKGVNGEVLTPEALSIRAACVESATRPAMTYNPA